MKQMFVVLFITAVVACNNSDHTVTEHTADQAPVPKVSKNPVAFNQSFDQLLESYYNVKDALVASDSVKANAAAADLAVNADSLHVETLADSTGVIKETALSFTGTISGSAKGLLEEKNLEAKRKQFQMISDAMYDLIRTVRYDREKVYHQYCPMAFNDAGAFWLSNKEEIRNPYFGKKMLTCGEVKDTLSF